MLDRGGWARDGAGRRGVGPGGTGPAPDEDAAAEALRVDREVRMLIDAGRTEAANALFDQLVSKVPPNLAPWTRAAVLTRRAVAAWRLRRIPLALELAAEGWSDIDVEHPRGSFAADTLGRLGYLLEGIGHRRASLEITRLAVAVARSGDDVEVLAHALQNLGGTLNFRACDLPADDAEVVFREARELLTEGLALAPDERIHLALTAALGASLAGLDDLAQAERTARRTLEVGGAEDNRWAMSVAHWVLATVRRKQGLLAQAVEFGRAAVDDAEAVQDPSLVQRYSQDLADTCHAHGDTEGEADALRRNIGARRTAQETLQEGLAQALDQRRLAIRAQRLATAAQEAAERDPLTGLANRLGLERAAPHMLNHAKSAARTPWLILIDVDWFKAVNDAAGHAAGDAALREIATVLRAECRVGDLIARWAGDEFVVLLTHPTQEDLVIGPTVAERIRAAVDSHDWTSVLGAVQHPTVSVGVATGRLAFERLFASADHALYEAKRKGRNRVEHYGA
ncbi:GGDEF domain-containing protein [Actinokineospora pegani]|uniref:GGDEF domain-containing protein n=1 Tax=Actinokineospora pegani TaxID=2654637 RepID=UPI001F204679|nr:GGDEF domain-containing protein [Actinokineospora pegani]